MLKKILFFLCIVIFFVGAGCIKKSTPTAVLSVGNNPTEVSTTNLVPIVEEYLNNTISFSTKDKKFFSAFISYGQEEKNNQLYYYIWAVREQFFLKNNVLTKGTAASGPIVLVFDKKNGVYTKITGHKLPSDGAAYNKSLETLFPKFILKKMNLPASDANKRVQFLQKETKTKAAFYFNYQLTDSLDKREEEKCIPFSFERYKLTPEQVQTTGVADWDTSFNSSTVPVYDLRAKIAPGYFADGVNFAGHFSVVSWSCGKKCQEHAIVDAQTGRIIKTGLHSQYGADFKLNSLLLVLNPYSAILGPTSSIVTQYYLIVENDRGPELKLICSYSENGKLSVSSTPIVDSTIKNEIASSFLLEIEKRYLSKSKDQCATMLIKCEEDERVFTDETGCGCESGGL